MARTYNNPPLIEAVCDFHFSSSQPWDWTIPGLFYELWVDMPPLSTEKVVLQARDMGQGEPLAILDALSDN